MNGKEPNQHDENRGHRRTGPSGKKDPTCLDPWPRVVTFSALAGGRPKYKSAQIKLLWPEIKKALADGHKLRQIWESLDEDGINLSYSKFRSYIARLKRSMPMDQTGQAPAEPPTKRATATEAVANDPLANLRDRLNNRPGFQFDERPPDIKKLI